MMNPWISTSLPLYALIVWVTSELARIESTSWANVSLGISSAAVGSTESANPTPRPATSIAHDWPIPRDRLRQRGKILRDLHAIREDGRQQSISSVLQTLSS